MGAFQNYPYADVHQLNLDWIIKEVKEVKNKEEEVDQAVLDAKGYADSAQESSQSASEALDTINDNIDQWNDDVDEIKTQVNTNTVDIAIQTDRIDQIISGTTPDANAELIDIRVGLEGATYSTAGDAVRGQILNLKKINGVIYGYGYIRADNGQISSGGTDRLFSRMIPCPPNTSITYVGENNHSGVSGVAFYDKYFRFISKDGGHGNLGDVTTVTSPSNTAYLRHGTKVSIASSSYVQFNNQYKGVYDNLQNEIQTIESFAYINGSTGADNENSGTPQMPFKTISGAISYGYRNLRIAVGTYNETISVDGGSLKLTADWPTFVSGSVTDRPKVIIDGGNSIATALTIENCSEVVLEDIVVQNCTSNGALINKCENVKLHNCEFNYNGTNGIVINYSNGVIRDCKAGNNTNDGFNMNYFGDTQFFNCVGHDNGDDGISHHQGCTGCINGGEWYNNVKGGVASPAHGAQIDILNIYSHDNGYGIWANADSDTVARTFRVWNSVMMNNSQYGLTCKRNHAILYNCKISGNTVGQTTAPSGGTIEIL